jgi:PAS domain S-box-containing protein
MDDPPKPRRPASRGRARKALADGLRAMHGSGDGYWEWDLIAGTAWYSDWFSRELAWEKEAKHEPLSAWQSYILAEDWPLLLREVRMHLEQHRPLALEVRAQAAGGHDRWWRISGSATRDDNGRPIQLSGNVRDVTATRRAQAVADTTHRMLQAAYDSLPIAVAVLNSAGEIVDASRAWREFPSSDALLGMRFGFGENYLSLCEAFVARNDSARALVSAIKNLLAGENMDFRHDYDCSLGGVSHRLRCMARSVEREAVRWVIVSHIDLAAFGAELEGSTDYKQFYEMILDAVPLHIAYVGRNHRLQYLNKSYEEWLRLPFSAIEAAPIEELADHAHRNEIAARIERVLSGAEVNFEVERTDGDGQGRALSVAYLPHVGTTGDVQGFFSVARDVSAERQLEVSLRQAQKLEAIGQMSGGLAHDLNNLLGVIIGNLQLLRRRIDTDPAALKAADTALRAATSGSDLAKSLLAFARKQPLMPASLAIDSVLSSIDGLLARAAGENTQITMNLGVGAGRARLDQAQFENAVLNLVLNARDAQSDGGLIRITTRASTEAESGYPSDAPSQSWLVEIADDGPGMAPDVARRAFEPFFTTKPDGKGTGLGLATVYGFARQSGGTATIDTQPGAGTRVRLWFPREEEKLS